LVCFGGIGNLVYRFLSFIFWFHRWYLVIEDNMEAKNIFACAVNCIDGRVQDAVKNYMKDKYRVDFIDMITEPGPNKILAENSSGAIIENIKKRIEISIKHHRAKVVAIAGHFGCAGNPAKKAEQIKHLKEARKTIESFGFAVEVILLWIGGDWRTVEKI